MPSRCDVKGDESVVMLCEKPVKAGAWLMPHALAKDYKQSRVAASAAYDFRQFL